MVAVAVYVGWLGCAFTFGALSSLFTLIPPVFGQPGHVGVASVHVLLVLLYLDFCSAWFLLGALFVALCALMVTAFRHHAACLKNQVSPKGLFTKATWTMASHDIESEVGLCTDHFGGSRHRKRGCLFRCRLHSLL